MKINYGSLYEIADSAEISEGSKIRYDGLEFRIGLWEPDKEGLAMGFSVDRQSGEYLVLVDSRSTEPDKRAALLHEMVELVILRMWGFPIDHITKDSAHRIAAEHEARYINLRSEK